VPHVFVTDEWFAELYERSYRRVVVTAYALTGDLGDAEEIAQDTYAIAYDRRRRVAAADNPEGWLHTVAVNLARRRHRRRRTLSRLLHKEIPPPPLWIGDHVDLHNAIRGLTDDHRAVVVLHYLADMPVDEVASVLGIAVGTVKSRLSRARAALAELLGTDREVENA
jgi:RNA polymerase sigma-70 factor (sigma-E family)